jgi:hypothetical protein
MSAIHKKAHSMPFRLSPSSRAPSSAPIPHQDIIIPSHRPRPFPPSSDLDDRWPVLSTLAEVTYTGSVDRPVRSWFPSRLSPSEFSIHFSGSDLSRISRTRYRRSTRKGAPVPSASLRLPVDHRRPSSQSTLAEVTYPGSAELAIDDRPGKELIFQCRVLRVLGTESPP